jgi:hypothetical protein
MMEEISEWKSSISNASSETTTKEKIIRALTNVEEAIGNHAPEAGELKKKLKQMKPRSGIESKNVTATARERRKPEIGIKDIHKMNSKTTNVIKLQKGSLEVGDKVKTSTTRFGKEYASRLVS